MLHRIWLGFFVVAFGSGLYQWLGHGDYEIFPRRVPAVFDMAGLSVELAIGQVGLLSLGFDWTVLHGSRWPDHGLFARGASRLYVHRGTGFYGFPMRIGVPGELSILELVVD